MMTQTPTLTPPSVLTPPRPRIDSTEILRGANAVEIEHGGQRYILRVRTIARAVAQAYYAQREKLGFPGLKKHKEAA